MTIPVADVVATASSGAAACLSGWMLVAGLGAKSLPGCGAGSACDEIAKSRWSKWGRLPVAGLGAGFYLLIAGLSITSSSVPWLKDATLCSMAFVAIGATIWFTAIQILLRRLCGYCVATHLCATIAAVEILRTVRPWRHEAFAAECFAAAIALGILIAGQILLRPRSYAVIAPTAEASTHLTAEQTKKSSTTTQQQIVAARNLSFLRGKVQLNTADYPLIGSQDATFSVALLFDFTCEQCHHLYKLLFEAVKQSHGNLVVVLLPVPLHKSCNPTVKCDQPEHKIRCSYTRLNWALWHTDRQLHQQWLEFFNSDTAPLPYGTALIKARELADLSQFEFKGPDARLDANIAVTVNLYKAAGIPDLPTLLLPVGMLRGRVEDVKQLQELLQKHISKSLFAKTAAGSAAIS
jgi:uncharacterized membrane protein